MHRALQGAEQCTEATVAAEDEAVEAAARSEDGSPRRSNGPGLSAEEALVEHFLRTHLPSKMPLLDAMTAEADDCCHHAAAADAAVAAVAKVQPRPWPDRFRVQCQPS